VFGLFDIQTISEVVAAASVVIGVIYYAFELRHENRTRDTDLVNNLFAFYNSQEFQEAYGEIMSMDFADYDDFISKNGSATSKTPLSVALRMVCGFYEQLGLLYHRRLVDIKLVVELFSVRRPWEKIRPIAIGARKELNQQDLYEWFEYLYNEVMKGRLDQ